VYVKAGNGTFPFHVTSNCTREDATMRDTMIDTAADAIKDAQKRRDNEEMGKGRQRFRVSENVVIKVGRDKGSNCRSVSVARLEDETDDCFWYLGEEITYNDGAFIHWGVHHPEWGLIKVASVSKGEGDVRALIKKGIEECESE
jgi:hypothetical protein